MTSVVPFFDPVTGAGNGVKLGTMATSPQGLVGISGESLVRVVRDEGLRTIATGFVEAQSVAVYPAVVPPATGAIVIVEIDSPVDVLITDSAGKRIGVDPATGDAVNDFGENGFDSGPGEPRFLGIKNPTPGAFDPDMIGTGDGPFAIKIYSSALGLPQVDLNRIGVSGTASIGHVDAYDFTLASDTAVAFVAAPPPPPPPPVDATAPEITGTLTGSAGNNGWYVSNVAVGWSVIDAESSVVSSVGCDPASISSDSAGQSFTCAASSAGGSASQTVTAKRDATPPTVIYSGQQAAYSLDQFVNITCNASDALAGLASHTCADISGAAYKFGAGPNTFPAAAADLAGNTATTSVTFNVNVTAAGVCGVINQFVANKGIANALCTKLNAAEGHGAAARLVNLRAFVNPVRAQSGKAISTGEAGILIGLAGHLRDE